MHTPWHTPFAPQLESSVHGRALSLEQTRPLHLYWTGHSVSSRHVRSV